LFSLHRISLDEISLMLFTRSDGFNGHLYYNENFCQHDHFSSLLSAFTLKKLASVYRSDFCRLSADDFITGRTKGIMIGFKRRVW